MAIFVPTMTTMTDGQTDCFTSCACTQGNKCNNRKSWQWLKRHAGGGRETISSNL